MRYKLFIILSLLAVTSCTGLPAVKSDLSDKSALVDFPFIHGKFRITHSMKAELPGSNNALLIGITSVDTELKTINAVIMTVEGIVLFDVNYKNNAIDISRAVPPFDSAGFASGLVDDIKLIYLSPECPEISGRTGGIPVRRYKCGNTAVDIKNSASGYADILKYENSSPVRTVHISSVNKDGIPEKAELTAGGLFGYSILLELINYEKL